VTSTTHVPLAESDPVHPHGARSIGKAPADQILKVTLLLQPRSERKNFIHEKHEALLKGKYVRLTREELEKEYGADPRALEEVESFAESHHLALISPEPGQRTVVLEGTSANLSAAFGVQRIKLTSRIGTYYGHHGPVQVPENLAGIVHAVLGLNEIPIVRRPPPIPSRIRHALKSSKRVSYDPVQLAQLYNFPKEFDGQGQCIALIELGGGYNQKDLASYFETLKLPVPEISVVSVDGAVNDPKHGSKDCNLEVQGDIELAAGFAPGAKLAIYFAPMTERGFYDATTKAVHDRQNAPSIISISFGEVEHYWPKRTMQLLNDVLLEATLLGVTVCCAAGDLGSSGGVPGGESHVFFPASSPYALACGGTQLKTAGEKIEKETVWDESSKCATGGGVSRVFARPTWQKTVTVPPSPNRELQRGRGLPDVAANANDYSLFVDEKHVVQGGTSAVAPLWAGLIARINHMLGHSVGFLNPFLYSEQRHLLRARAIREITQGSNGAYKAHAGWNCCTGLGTPHGGNLASALKDASERGEVGGVERIRKVTPRRGAA
jgi:kumamolisin